MIRHLPVAISVEQIASAWARREAGPSGATVIVDHEISGRQRLGIAWKATPSTALSCAVIVRPALGPEAEAILWVVALVAAARAVPVSPGWPDLLFSDQGSQVGAVGLEVQAEAGIMTAAVLSLRVDLSALAIVPATSPDMTAVRRTIADRFAAEALRCSALAGTDPSELLSEYAALSFVVGKRVRAQFLPKGETRGRAVAVDPTGTLILESPTGMLERLVPGSVLRVDPL